MWLETLKLRQKCEIRQKINLVNCIKHGNIEYIAQRFQKKKLE